jgi:phage baseplate assembly protein gpV
MRRVVEREIDAQRTSALGVVTTVFAHTDTNDENNYEVSVKLKHEDLELRRVPIVIAHTGFVAPPQVGDLVLVQFVNNDVNQAVVAGRFYDAEVRPPLHKENEILIEHRVNDGTLNQLRFAADGSIYIQRDVAKPEDNSKAKASIRIDGGSGDIEIRAGEKIVLVLKNDAEIEITADGNPVKINCDKVTLTGKMDIEGDVQITGDLVVTNGGTKTTISGNTVTGG